VPAAIKQKRRNWLMAEQKRIVTGRSGSASARVQVMVDGLPNTTSCGGAD
jgi:hypothetical protein